MLATLLCAVALTQHGWLTGQIVPAPTGENGFEDYIAAFDVIREAPAMATTNDVLSDRRQKLKYFSTALNLIRTGNDKPIGDPRSGLTTASPLLELPYAEMAARLFGEEAYVRFAESKSASGLQSILTGLEFAESFGSLSARHHASAERCANICFSEFAQHSRRLSDRDATVLAQWSKTALARPAPLANCLAREENIVVRSLEPLATEPAKFLQSNDPELQPAYWASSQRLSPARLAKTWEPEVTARFTALRQTLATPESTWAISEPDPKSLVNRILPGEKSLRDALIWRTRLRLLRLHAEIIKYRWENDRLPPNLKALPDQKVCIDPRFNKPYEFAPSGDTRSPMYELASGKDEKRITLTEIGKEP